MTPERKYYIKVTLVFYAIWIVVFQVVGRYAATLKTYNPTIGIDRMIPLIPDFVWFYELCYVFPFLLLFVIMDFHRLNIILLSIILANVSAFIVYLGYPIAFPRPELGQSIAERILSLEYSSDFHPGANKLPSLHVAFAWFVYFACRGQRLSKIAEMLVFVLAGMITLSTLFVKQHIVLDVVAGILWAILIWRLANYLYPLLTNPKFEPRVALMQMLKKTGILIIDAFIFWIALPVLLWMIGKVANELYPISLPKHAFLYIIAILFVVAGIALIIYSWKYLADKGHGLPVSHLPPVRLVSTGPYKYSRHPIYVSYMLVWAGFACIAGSFWMLTFSLALLIIGGLLYILYYEEQILRKHFGDSYDSYRGKTRIIPFKSRRGK